MNPRLSLITPGGERDFELVGHGLGRGGFGSVHRAVDSYGTSFAVKLVALPGDRDAAKDLYRSFESEAKTLAAIRHPNVVHFITYGLAPDLEFEGLRGYLGLVMELVDGTTVRTLIRRSGLPPSLIREYARQICAGIGALKGADGPIVHRDIKPENLVVSAKDERLRIVDFGLGRESPTGTGAAQTSVAGTPLYMAPEQFEVGSALTPATDLYATAVTLYECLTGRVPLAGKDPVEIYMRRASGEPPAGLEGPLASFDVFFARVLLPEPGLRPSDALSFWQAFDEAADAAGLLLGESPVEPPTVEPVHRVAPAPDQWSEYRSGMVRALDLEIVAVKEDLKRRGADSTVAARQGQRIDSAPDESEYECRVPHGLSIAEETPLVGQFGPERIKGRVSGGQPDKGILRIRLSRDVGETFERATLTFDSTFLLEQLRETVQGLPKAGANLQLGLKLLDATGVTGLAPVPADSSVNPSQQSAIETALGSETSYIWGPPGTGKTRTLGYLLRNMLVAGERAIVAAPTNVAVDNVALALLATGEVIETAVAEGQILRLGDASAEVRRRGLHIETAFEHTARELCPQIVVELESFWRRFQESGLAPLTEARAKRRSRPLPETLRGRYFFAARSLQGALSRTEDPTPALKGLITTSALLAPRVREIEQASVSRASVVFCTLTRLHLGGLLKGQHFDRVVVDEVSMAPLPTVLVAATYGEKSATVAGDFQQLPAVHLSRRPEVQRWFSGNIYDFAGIADTSADHAARPMLREQYRMHPEISWLVNTLFYGGRLEDADEIRAIYRSASGGALALIDTSAADSISDSISSSRRNLVHADIAARLVQLLISTGQDSVAVIAPYVAQVRAIRDAIKRVNPDILKSCEVSTVHTFQGREKEVVVLDLTDAPPIPPTFLNETHNRDAPKILNVALSRARRRLLVIAHTEYLLAQLGFRSTPSALFGRIRVRGTELEARPWPKSDLLRFLGVDATQDPLGL